MISTLNLQIITFLLTGTHLLTTANPNSNPSPIAAVPLSPVTNTTDPTDLTARSSYCSIALYESGEPGNSHGNCNSNGGGYLFRDVTSSVGCVTVNAGNKPRLPHGFNSVTIITQCSCTVHLYPYGCGGSSDAYINPSDPGTQVCYAMSQFDQTMYGYSIEC